MIVGVLSDTHLSPLRPMKETASVEELRKDDNLGILYDLLEPHFRGADAIIHAGDINDFSILKILEDFAVVYAVSGNMDPDPVKKILPVKRIESLGGFNIGISHGSGGPDGISSRTRQKFSGDKVDCIVFGHSHSPYNSVEEGILMFNPGSALDRRFAVNRTIGILRLEEKIRGGHIFLE